MPGGGGGDDTWIMLTINELCAVPWVSEPSTAELTQLLRGAADIHLKPGEYAVHEGDETALYVVMSGTLEVTKLVDGIQRVLGARKPGEIHGEVPLIYGTRFQSGARASEPSRVRRIAAQH